VFDSRRGHLPHTAEELQAAEERRAATSDRIAHSTARRRLIVAGPGTGKTHNFRRALQAVGGGGLALTFIRALAGELARDIGELAQVNTFHGYCKHLAYRLPLEGLGRGLDYYPPLLILIAEDLRFLGCEGVRDRDLERAFHTLNNEERFISGTLEITAYYNAVSHADVVYRVLTHLAEHPDSVPEVPLLVVDEYQDFCRLETEFIDILRTRSPVLAAGDDDQALYGFKDASPRFIRELAQNPDFERFDLPYCSRCTEVIVDAVNNVVAEAQRRGNLANRIDREYLCYLPDKLADSEAHPAIIWAACSVHNRNAPYMGLYAADEISRIPAADIAESHDGKYPTALVIGRSHLVSQIYATLKERFPNATFRASSTLEVDALDGYQRLAQDERSRLGWRILLHTDPFPNAEEVIVEALKTNRDLADLVPDRYRARHLRVAELIKEVVDSGAITNEQIAELEEVVDRAFDEIAVAVGREEDDDDEPEPEPEAGVPTIICTSLLGAKGLSAGHVFIAGMNNGTFPKEPNAVTDDEVCKLIVGLSRTRKACHLVSCGMFGGPPWQQPSTFLNWLHVPIEKRDVNKSYWA
jgi:superfamily I DNA/RNA helicase